MANIQAHLTSARARLLALAAALLFSTGGAGIKASSFNGIQVSSLRSGIAALALLLWLWWTRSSARPNVPLPVLSGTAAVYAATLTLFVLATKLTTAANAIFLQATAPIFVLLLGMLLLRERVQVRDLGYLAALAFGLAFCFLGRAPASAIAPDPALGNLLAVLCSVTWALTLIGLRHIERDPGRQGGGLSTVAIGNALACVAALPFALPLPSAGLAEWTTLGYLGVFQIGLAYVCLTTAMRHLPALEVSLLLLIEPVLNPVWTWTVRGEHPGRWTIAGGALIVIATAVRAMHDARRPVHSQAATPPPANGSAAAPRASSALRRDLP